MSCAKIFGPPPYVDEPIEPCTKRPVGECELKKKPPRLEREQEIEEIGLPWISTQVLQLNRHVKWRCPPKPKQIEALGIQSLGHPVGISFGSYALMNYPNVKPSKENSEMQAFATCFMAFGEIYITPEIEWDNLVLNRILVEGKEHFEKIHQERMPPVVEKVKEEIEEEKPKARGRKSKKKKTKAPKPIKENDIPKTFVICENSMEIELFDPFVVGTLVSNDPKIASFYYGIDKFMRKLTYCLLTVANQHFLIWKSSGLYFVFDCYGRNCELQRDENNGFAILIGLSSLEAVNHFIINLSNLPPEEFYIIRKVKMLYIFPCCIFKNEIERRIRKREFEMVNDYYAVLKGHLHIGLPCFKKNRNKFSLAIALTALIHSKIDAPSTWDSYAIDKTLVMANGYYNLWTNCIHNAELVIHEVPREIDMGKYTATISVIAVEACGSWNCMPNYKRSSLTLAIKRMFAKSSNLIVQVAERSYALWKRGDFYYLFDPYKHECRGSKFPRLTAHLHMCSMVNMLCCIFANQIVDLPSPSSFYIHSIKIIDLKIRDKYKFKKTNQQTCKCVFKEPDLEEIETMSLNTSLDDIQCEEALKCLVDKYIQPDDAADLDSPSLSQTMIPVEYERLDDDGEEEGETEEEETEEDEESDETVPEEGSDVEEKGKKRKKGKKGKKVKKEKVNKEKVKKEKVQKEKVQKEKVEKEKVKKEKVQKEKVQKEKVEKEKVPKEKVQKEKVQKEKVQKEKVEKEKVEKEKVQKEKVQKEKVQKEKVQKEKVEKEKPPKEKTEKPVERKKTENEAVIEGSRESGSEEVSITSSEVTGELPLGCFPNSYPGYCCYRHNLAVVGSESGSYESLCNLIKTGFKCADRILVMTPWGNYVVFKSLASYLLYDGCTCNVNRFRHLDLTVGTAGLICFSYLHDLIGHIMRGKGNKTDKDLLCESKHLKWVIDDICDQYCG